MRRIVIGTAGHVDHGKSTLTQALTGTDTDRLAEEKKRGISIQLGFAPLPITEDLVAGIVDVPGHEKFIKTMLSGVAGIDMVLLVIAADEGVMPQTQEHLDIVSLLGVERGVIVLNKADLVEPDWLELVQEEVREAVADTPLKDAPMVAVSAVTGQGLDQLKAEIKKIALTIPPRPASGQARMPIDRSFSATGFGTVITGTLWNGMLHLGDVMELSPGETETRIRNLQVHGKNVESASAGQRVAVNLAGVEVAQAPKGGWLAAKGLLSPSYRLDVELTLLKHAKDVSQRERVHLHHGTCEALGRIQLLDREELAAGDTCYAQIALEEPLTALRGDRFVIRSYSPTVTIGGGRILEGQAVRHKRYKDEVLAAMAVKAGGTPAQLFANTLRETKPYLLTVKDALNAVGVSQQEFEQLQAELPGEGVLFLGENDQLCLAAEREAEMRQALYQALADYHKEFVVRQGMPREELRSKVFSAINLKNFQQLLTWWGKQEVVKLTSTTVALPDFQPQAPQELLVWKEKTLKILAEQAYAPPAWSELTASLPAKLRGEAYLWLEEDVIRLADDMVWSRQAFENAKALVQKQLDEEGSVTLANVRDFLNTSRKYALPFLEYLDNIKFTRRVGEERVAY